MAAEGSGKRCGVQPRRSIGCEELDRLIAAAAHLFAQRGFDGVSMREISRASDLPIPSIYYHFPTKQMLYQEALEAKLDRVIDIVAQSGSGPGSPSERFSASVEVCFDLFCQDPDLVTLAQRDMADAIASNRTLAALPQFQHFSKHFSRLSALVMGRPPKEGTMLALASLIFGYCAMVLSMKGAETHPSGYETSRRNLTVHCLRLIQPLSAPAE